MNPRFPLIALVFALLFVPSPVHAVKFWRSEFRVPLDHSISRSRSIERRQLRSERLVTATRTGPVRNFNTRAYRLIAYRDRVSFRGGKRSPLNVLQRANPGRGGSRSPLTRRVS